MPSTTSREETRRTVSSPRSGIPSPTRSPAMTPIPSPSIKFPARGTSTTSNLRGRADSGRLDAEIAYKLIHDELALDGTPVLK